MPDPAPALPPDVPSPAPMVATPWYRRSSVAALWKTCVGFAGAALTGQMAWRDAGIAAGLAVLGASTDILFGPDSYRAP